MVQAAVKRHYTTKARQDEALERWWAETCESERCASLSAKARKALHEKCKSMFEGYRKHAPVTSKVDWARICSTLVDGGFRPPTLRQGSYLGARTP